MKKLLLILAFIFVGSSIYAQDWWIDTECVYDVISQDGGSDTQGVYKKIQFALDNTSFGTDGQVLKSEFINILSSTNSTNVRVYNYCFPLTGCTNGPCSNGYIDNNSFGNATAILTVGLYKNSSFITNILVNFEFIKNQVVNTQLQNQYSNINLPDLEYGSGYSLKYSFDYTDFETYVSPFHMNRIMNSQNFTIGEKAEITSPSNSLPLINMTPTFEWSELGVNGEYKLVINKVSDSSVIFESNFIDTNNLTIPNLTLEYGTNYSAKIISKFDNAEFEGDEYFFETTSENVSFVKTDFYQQGITPNSNNPNNYLNQDLPIRFKVKVSNELAQSLSTLTGTITTTTPGVTITDNSVNFGNVSSGGSIWSNDEFEIMVDSSVPNGTLLEFQLSTDDQVVSGGPWLSSFSFPIAPLQNGNIVLVDQNGNNDGNPDPGEHLKLFPKIDNNSNVTMAQVYGTLSSDDSFLNFTSDYQKYNWISNIHEPILPTDTDIMPEFPFELDYPASETLQELNFNLELQGNLNDANGTLLKWQTNFKYNEGVEPPPIMVSTNPEDDATDVAVDTDFEITFNKNITAVSGKFIHLYKADNTLITSIETTDAQVTIINETVTINPTADLLDGTGYYIIIDQGAFIDTTNNDFEGITSPNTWNFTTIQSNPPEAPVLTATAISDTEIELSWNAVDTATNYQIFSCDESITYTTNETNTTYTVSGLTEATMYDFIVKAENQAGLSVASNCVSEETFCNHPWGSIITYGNQLITSYGIVTIDGNPASEDDKVGVFSGNELRGLGNIVINNGVAYTIIPIEGNGSGIETFSFKIWDQSTCQEVPVSFTVNASTGDTIGFPPNYLPIAGDTTTEINDFSLSNFITIYPNPTNDILYMDNKENIKVKKITLYNFLGKKILQIEKNTNQISLKSLTKGVYFIKINTNKGNLLKKVIKN